MDQKLQGWLDRFFVRSNVPNWYVINPSLGLASKICINITDGAFAVHKGIPENKSTSIGWYAIVEFDAMMNEMKCMMKMFIDELIRSGETEDLQLWTDFHSIVSL